VSAVRFCPSPPRSNGLRTSGPDCRRTSRGRYTPITYLHATRAELLRRLDRVEDAPAAYERALKLVHSDAERRFLEQPLAGLGERAE
jgi:predicted RNA polymerase sigma factor